MVLGDLVGIGLELIVCLLVDIEVCEKVYIVLIVDEVEMCCGMCIVGCEFFYWCIDVLEILDFVDVMLLLYFWFSQGGDEFLCSEVSVVGGCYSLEIFVLVFELICSGRIDVIFFGLLNKILLYMVGMDYSDELYWFVECLGFGGLFCEFNVFDDFWILWVIFYVVLVEVLGLFSQEWVGEVICLIDDVLCCSGLVWLCIGVCGLNLYNGDNGSFGCEELDIIVLVVQKVCEQGIVVDGLYFVDIIFFKVQGDVCVFDVVVIMYYDQGQIVIKLMGFFCGVIVQGGLLIFIVMLVYGIVFDIVGQGRVDVGVICQVFEIVCWMGRCKV